MQRKVERRLFAEQIPRPSTYEPFPTNPFSEIVIEEIDEII
jgi:hypothetical protein